MLTPVGREGVGLRCTPFISTFVNLLLLQNHRPAGRPDLIHDIPHLLLDLLLRQQAPLPQLIAHAPFLQQGSQRLLCVADGDHAADVFGRAPQQRRSQHAFRYGGRFLVAGLGLEVQEREVDVALEVRWEPGFEGGCLDCLFVCWRLDAGV